MTPAAVVTPTPALLRFPPPVTDDDATMREFDE
jgi:hypothetical protein